MNRFNLATAIFEMFCLLSANCFAVVIDTTPGSCSNGSASRYLGQTFTAEQPVLRSFSFEAYSSIALSVADFQFQILVTEANLDGGPFNIKPSPTILFESPTYSIPLGETQLVEVDFGGIELETGEIYVLLIDGFSSRSEIPADGGIRSQRCDNPYPGGYVIQGPVNAAVPIETTRDVIFASHWSLPRVGIDFTMKLVFSEEGDFDIDEVINANDIDLLSEAIANNSTDQVFDVNKDGLINADDHSELITGIIGAIPGDADLDGTVAFTDFLILANSFEQTSGWGTGDFNASLTTTLEDFLILANNFGKSSNITSVPEPTSVQMLLLGLLCLAGAIRRCRRSATIV